MWIPTRIAGWPEFRWRKRAPASKTKARASQGDARRTGSALVAIYQLTWWFIPTLNRLPRPQKFLLGTPSGPWPSRDWSG